VTFALIGDSQGVGLEPGLRELLSIVFADPKVGWTTARIRRDGPFEGALRSSASTIILVTGGNDDPLDVTALRDMIASSRAAGKRLVVVGPVFALTDDAARHDRARTQLRAATVAPAVFVDAYPMTRDLASTANVHLTATRYRTYARRLASAVGSGTGMGFLGWATLSFAVAYLITRNVRSAAVAAILPP
jgi:uncharacterized membrane protein